MGRSNNKKAKRQNKHKKQNIQPVEPKVTKKVKTQVEQDSSDSGSDSSSESQQQVQQMTQKQQNKAQVQSQIAEQKNQANSSSDESSGEEEQGGLAQALQNAKQAQNVDDSDSSSEEMEQENQPAQNQQQNLQTIEQDSSGDDSSNEEQQNGLAKDPNAVDTETDEEVEEEKVEEEPQTPSKPQYQQDSNPIFEIFVGNISFDATQESMTEFFKDCGNLINVKLLRGKAFVKFSTQESQEKALALDQTDMNGRPLRIETPKNRMQFAQDRSDKTARHKWDQDDVFEAFIGNVSFDSTEQELNEFFGQCGNLINVKLLRGKAFVKFSTQESLDKAVALNGSDVSGRNLRIEAAAKRNSGPKTDRDPESTTVFVGGLYYYTNEAKLKEVFDHCGEVLDIRMPLNEDQSANRGFAHVEFASADAVEKAMKMAGTQVEGRKIRMDYSNSRGNRMARQREGRQGGGYRGRSGGRGGYGDRSRSRGRGGYGSRGRGGYGDRSRSGGRGGYGSRGRGRGRGGFGRGRGGRGGGFGRGRGRGNRFGGGDRYGGGNRGSNVDLSNNDKARAKGSIQAFQGTRKVL